MWKASDFIPGETYSVREHLVGDVNHPKKQIYRQMRSNVKRHLPQMMQVPPHEGKLMILCGGPSLNDFVSTIKRKRKTHHVLVCNNVHEWALDHRIAPSACIILDARPHNVRFLERPQETCHYFLCSQVHPSLFDVLEGYKVTIWHAGAPSKTEKRILDDHYAFRWGPVMGGTSVGLRAIGLGVMLGYRQITIYGLDSCFRGGEHHAYPQQEDDVRHAFRVKLGRKTFHCSPWMMTQADEFIRMAGMLPDGLKLSVEGDGLIAEMVRKQAKQKTPVNVKVINADRVN